MSCDCEKKLAKIKKKVEDAEAERSKVTLEDGAFWGRIVATDFMKIFSKGLSSVNCDCESAKLINQVCGFFKAPKVKKAIVGDSAGSVEDRGSQDFSFFAMHQLLCSDKKTGGKL